MSLTALRASSRPLLILILLVVGSGAAVAVAVAQEEESGTAAPAQETEPPAPALPSGDDLPLPPQFWTGVNRTLEDVAADVFYWGQSGTVTGTLGDNAFIGGQVVAIDGGTVSGDLFAFGSSIEIDGEVMGDVYAFGSTFSLSPGAVIHGNLLAFSGSLRLAGTVRGHVRGGGGGTTISGNTGPIRIEAGSLSIASTAVIRGDLQYTSNDEADIADGADIQGAVEWNREDEDDEGEVEEEGGLIGFWSIAWKLWSYLSALIVGCVLLLVGGRVTRQPAASLAGSPASGLGFGFVVVVVFPVACLVAVVLLLTLPLGLLGLVTFTLLLYLARLVAAQFLGAWILSRATGNARPSEYASLAVGLALLMLVGMLPYLGFLIRLTAVILGLGGIYLALRHFGFPSMGGSAQQQTAA